MSCRRGSSSSMRRVYSAMVFRWLARRAFSRSCTFERTLLNEACMRSQSSRSPRKSSGVPGPLRKPLASAAFAFAIDG